MIQQFAVWILPVLFAITVHEVAHGWVADKLGDSTAKILGRLTLNPLKHIDVVGTIIVPTVLFFLTGFVFGWARPVPVNFFNLKKPRRDAALVALAGPGANLLMMFIWAIIGKVSLILINHHAGIFYPLYLMGKAGVFINLVLMVLNLIPIPPLDGSRVVSSLLPPKASEAYNRFGRFGFFILLALLATGLLGRIVGPPIFILQKLVFGLFGL